MEQKFTHTKTYRYEVIERGSPKRILYVLHGYGQLVKYFIRKFQSLPDDILIVAPEGMHRFYLEGSSGRVGASWMTKEAREDDILDNIDWLNELHQIITHEYKIEEAHLLGFSQGGATAARWKENGIVNFNSLTLWACVFPPDLDRENLKTSNIPSSFVIGDEDQFYNSKAQDELCKFYHSLNFDVIKYKGNHDIDNETLISVLRQMIK